MHNIYNETYPYNVNKKSVQAEWDDYSDHEDWQEGGGGLGSDIHWHDLKLKSEEAAAKWVEDHDDGWYDQLAVSFYDTSSILKKAKFIKLDEQINQAYAKQRELENDLKINHVSSKFIGCLHCGSKFNVETLKQHPYVVRGNRCPICGESLLSPTELKKRESVAKKIEDLKAKKESLYKEEIKKMKMKASNLKWYVKVEFHT